jgi:hypothetical protein
LILTLDAMSSSAGAIGIGKNLGSAFLLPHGNIVGDVEAGAPPLSRSGFDPDGAVSVNPEAERVDMASD